MRSKQQRLVEVISECGINHNGNMYLAAKMIRKAKAIGADVAKFQLFNADRLIEEINPNLPEENKQWVKKTELSKDDLAFLSKTCEENDIEFMSSVFDVSLVDWLEEIGVRRYKIPKFLSVDIGLLNKVLYTGKPVIVSTDDKYFRGNFYTLYCISKYPAELEELDFDNEMFNYNFDGFSDHTCGVVAPITAMVLGAKIIEKHFTLDKNMEGPDHCCSADVWELSAICEFRNEIETLLYRKSD